MSTVALVVVINPGSAMAESLTQTVRVPPDSGSPMTELGELQRLMNSTYGDRDRARGIPATVAWLAEEVGELAKAARKGTRDEQLHELGDALAWLASLANQLGLSLDDAVARYRDGCPRCGGMPCACE
jgi:NTP pyrophosphatase (non-canonical NTP hydrolase)